MATFGTKKSWELLGYKLPYNYLENRSSPFIINYTYSLIVFIESEMPDFGNDLAWFFFIITQIIYMTIDVTY